MLIPIAGLILVLLGVLGIAGLLPMGLAVEVVLIVVGVMLAALGGPWRK